LVVFELGFDRPHQRCDLQSRRHGDGGWRRGNEVKLKAAVDEALKETPSVETCVIVRRTGSAQEMQDGRDFWWHELMEQVDANCPAEELDSEQPLFILYTSGTTGKPKGILHTTAGYLLEAHLTTKWVFDLKDEDVYWCTADIGWVTGHSYVVYGPLSNGATALMYEGGTQLSGAGSFLADDRTPPREHLLHCADRNPGFHQMGQPVAAETRSFEPAFAGDCR
jgi:acyl-coenzyme A synthetase/AMP-(fatty) acid ligase